MLYSTNKEMRREKKTKRIKIILGCTILVILIIVGIVVLVKNYSDDNDNPNSKVETDKSITYSLPDTKYKNMEVTNVELEYLKENGQTMVTMIVKNTTGTPITSQQSFIVKFLNQDDIELINAGTVIGALDVNAETSISLILTGDFTSIKKVILEDPQADASTNTTETTGTTETE